MVSHHIYLVIRVRPKCAQKSEPIPFTTTMSYGMHASSETFHCENGTGGKPFFGQVDSTMNAFRLVLAAELGLVPRITQRSSQSNRMHMIASGSIIIFSAQESGMKRWRDGLLWSPSRIEGNFLVSIPIFLASLFADANCRCIKRCFNALESKDRVDLRDVLEHSLRSTAFGKECVRI